MRRTRVGLMVDGRTGSIEGEGVPRSLAVATASPETPPLPDVPTLERIANLVLELKGRRAAQSSTVYFELEYAYERAQWNLTGISIDLSRQVQSCGPTAPGREQR